MRMVGGMMVVERIGCRLEANASTRRAGEVREFNSRTNIASSLPTSRAGEP